MNSFLQDLGILNPKEIYRNLEPARLVEKAVARGEGCLSSTGALVVETGKYTGRSPDDRFVVDEPEIHNEIDWGKINVPISPERFDSILGKACAYLQGRELFVFDGFAGADPAHRLPVRVINELASQNLFIHQLLVRPSQEELKDFIPGFTVIAAPGFKCIPEVDGVHSEAAILLNFEKKIVLIAGSHVGLHRSQGDNLTIETRSAAVEEDNLVYQVLELVAHIVLVTGEVGSHLTRFLIVE